MSKTKLLAEPEPNGARVLWSFENVVNWCELIVGLQQDYTGGMIIRR